MGWETKLSTKESISRKPSSKSEAKSRPSQTKAEGFHYHQACLGQSPLLPPRKGKHMGKLKAESWS